MGSLAWRAVKERRGAEVQHFLRLLKGLLLQAIENPVVLNK